MCGLAGMLLRRDGPGLADPEDVLDRMTGVLAHRGPDGAGLRWDGPCGLGHRRLAVIDPTQAGAQPMESTAGDALLAINGEVYDFPALRARFALDARGSRFRSRTDAEVVLELLRLLGPDALPALDGMFALAFWDRRRRRLLLARDPWGVKPLFTLEDPRGIFFASEIKALLEVPGVERRVDPEALAHFLACDYVPGAATAFEGIRELRPGHALALSWEDGARRLWRWWRPVFSERADLTARDAEAESLALLRAAVRRQQVADVPVGVMLSGGMDSSALCALLAECRGGGDFCTFSVGFDDPSFDESAWAAQVSRAFGTRHRAIRVRPERVAALLEPHLAHVDEPYADGAAIPTWLLAEEASREVTVLLSGEGGDEVFAGYDTHAAWKARRLYRRLVPGLLRREVIAPLADRLPVSHRKLSFDFLARRFAAGCELDVPEAHFAWRRVLPEARARALLGRPPRAPAEALFRAVWDDLPGVPELDRLLAIDFAHHLADDLMVKNDRMTMAWSLEARVPFTDQALVRFLASVPARLKLPGVLGGQKALLRRATRGLLPDAIRRRPKVGLEMPYSRWLRAELFDLAADHLLAGGGLGRTGLFVQAEVERLWREHQAGGADQGRALWGLLSFAVWHRLYIASAGWREHVRRPR